MKLIVFIATLFLIPATAVAQGNLYNPDFLDKDTLNRMRNNRVNKPASGFNRGQQTKPPPGYNWGFKGQLGSGGIGGYDGSNIQQLNPVPRTRQQAPRRTTSPNMGKICCPNGYMQSFTMCVNKKQSMTRSRVYSTGTIDASGVCRGVTDITDYLTGGR
jgi:hypothetical protein